MNIYDIIIISLLILFVILFMGGLACFDEIYEKYALKKLKKRTLRPKTAYIAFYDEPLSTGFYQTLTANDLQYLLQKIYIYLLKKYNAEDVADKLRNCINTLQFDISKCFEDGVISESTKNELMNATNFYLKLSYQK